MFIQGLNYESSALLQPSLDVDNKKDFVLIECQLNAASRGSSQTSLVGLHIDGVDESLTVEKLLLRCLSPHSVSDTRITVTVTTDVLITMKIMLYPSASLRYLPRVPV